VNSNKGIATITAPSADASSTIEARLATSREALPLPDCRFESVELKKHRT